MNGQTTAQHKLAPFDVIELGHTFFLYVEEPAGDFPDDFDVNFAEHKAQGLDTLVPALRADFEKLSRLAKAGVPVVVLGETGTGKEVTALALHELSGRKGRFVSVNCGAIPESLIESELFGSARGAFSGSVGDRQGLIRSADHGTLFLDEIGDLPLASQTAFLRVLQEQRVRAVGSTEAVFVDFRLVSATNRDLEQLVRGGTFRGDLFGRIATFRLTLPCLRDRRQDLGILVATLLRRLAGEEADKVRLTPEAARTILAYRFPLNIRELEAWLKTALALSAGEPITPDHFPEQLDLEAPAEDAESTLRPLTPEQQQHREELVELLKANAGNVSAVARITGKARNQVQRWLKRYSLDPDDYR